MQLAGSLAVACRLFVVACMWVLVPGPGIEPGPPALGAQSPNYHATRQVPSFFLTPALNSVLKPWVLCVSLSCFFKCIPMYILWKEIRVFFRNIFWFILLFFSLINLFLAVLGLRCRAGGELGLLFVVVCGLLVAEHRL